LSVGGCLNVDISTNASVLDGFSAAKRCAISPPKPWPTITALPSLISDKNFPKSSASESIVMLVVFRAQGISGQITRYLFESPLV